MFDSNYIGIYLIEVSIILVESAIIYFFIRPKKLLIQHEVLKSKPFIKKYVRIKRIRRAKKCAILAPSKPEKNENKSTTFDHS